MIFSSVNHQRIRWSEVSNGPTQRILDLTIEGPSGRSAHLTLELLCDTWPMSAYGYREPTISATLTVEGGGARSVDLVWNEEKNQGEI